MKNVSVDASSMLSAAILNHEVAARLCEGSYALIFTCGKTTSSFGGTVLYGQTSTGQLKFTGSNGPSETMVIHNFERALLTPSMCCRTLDNHLATGLTKEFLDKNSTTLPSILAKEYALLRICIALQYLTLPAFMSEMPGPNPTSRTCVAIVDMHMTTQLRKVQCSDCAPPLCTAVSDVDGAVEVKNFCGMDASSIVVKARCSGNSFHQAIFPLILADFIVNIIISIIRQETLSMRQSVFQRFVKFVRKVSEATVHNWQITWNNQSTCNS